MIRFFLFFLFVSYATAAAQVADRHVIKHNGSDRHYYLFVPKNLPRHAPLVVALHGMGGNAANLRFGIGLSERAQTHGFAVVYPQGERLQQGSRHWNAGFDFSTTDDLGFLTELIATLKQEHDFGPVSVLGISMGAFMAYHLACTEPANITAIAAVIGTMGGPAWRSCPEQSSVSLLHIHGKLDPMIPYEQFEHWSQGFGGSPGVPQVVAKWADRISATRVSMLPPQPEVEVTEYLNPITGAEARLLTLKNFGHDWPHLENSGFSAIDAVVSFFLDHKNDL